MVQKNPFLKYLIKDKKEDIFHSSGYAKAQNGSNIGAASVEPYKVRVNIGQHRRIVKGYRDSEIMTGSKNKDIRAKTYTPPADEGKSRSARPPVSVKKPGVSLKK